MYAVHIVHNISQNLSSAECEYCHITKLKLTVKYFKMWICEGMNKKQIFVHEPV